MRILLTNDDGISHFNLQILGKRLLEEHDVWIIAPEDQRSACSHSITLRGPIILKKQGERTYACSGTPVDCVMVALNGFLPVDIDIVISGINSGPNLGTDIIYSGTAGAARQAALMEKPGLAVSVCTRENSNPLSSHVEFIAQNLTSLLMETVCACILYTLTRTMAMMESATMTSSSVKPL